VINTKIESTSGEQTSMTSQMNDNIAIITQLGDESAADDQESIIHTDSVTSQTNHLFTLVSKFKV
jgi:methyl-accepting chemotaxis protein